MSKAWWLDCLKRWDQFEAGEVAEKQVSGLWNGRLWIQLYSAQNLMTFWIEGHLLMAENWCLMKTFNWIREPRTLYNKQNFHCSTFCSYKNLRELLFLYNINLCLSLETTHFFLRLIENLPHIKAVHNLKMLMKLIYVIMPHVVHNN